MEFLVILVGFIALFLALNARKGVASLQLQLNSLLTRLSRLEDALDDLRRHPQAPPSAAPVPEAPVAAALVPPAEAVTPQPEPPSMPRTRSTASSARPQPSFSSASSALPPCWPPPCTDRRWRALGLPARSWCRCSSLRRRRAPGRW